VVRVQWVPLDKGEGVVKGKDLLSGANSTGRSGAGCRKPCYFLNRIRLASLRSVDSRGGCPYVVRGDSAMHHTFESACAANSSDIF
jgi:hypothetical protein